MERLIRYVRGSHNIMKLLKIFTPIFLLRTNYKKDAILKGCYLSSDSFPIRKFDAIALGRHNNT